MNRVEQHSLFSERAALERMIAATPAEDVIDLRSLQVRLEIINRALAKHPVETRFGQDNLHEEPQLFSGVFQGALPKRRTFEFRLAGTAEVITGKIGPAVVNVVPLPPDRVLWLRQAARQRATRNSTRIEGNTLNSTEVGQAVVAVRVATMAEQWANMVRNALDNPTLKQS